MRNDEFNDIKVTNEKEVFSSFEYGKSQSAEFTSYTENKNNPNRDELNSTTNVNNENVKVGKVQTNNNDIIDKAVQASESAAASSTVSATAATTSASTAATVGATSAGVVAATAVVAVTVVSATVGINIYAQCHFNYLKATHNEISYELVLESDLTSVEDEGNIEYRIWVEDEFKTYNQYHPLGLGVNEGVFEMLTPNTEYAVTVASLTTVGGEELRGLPIYSGTIKTTDVAASVDINYIRPGENEISWELELTTNEADENEYALWCEVENKIFNWFDLIDGTNEGAFTDLMPETTYTLSVASISYTQDQEPIKGTPIWSQNFTTLAIQASVSFSHLQADKTRLDYGLDLEVAVGNNNNYAIWLQSDYDGYNNYNVLNVGENTGTFTDLTPNTIYKLSVAVFIYDEQTEEVSKGESIYEDVITTEANDPYMSFNWNKLYDPDNNSIEIELSFDDPEDIYSDLTFEVFDELGNDKVFSLLKQEGKQTLYGNSSVNPGGLYPSREDAAGGDTFDFTSRLAISYVFSYKENGVINSETSESDVHLVNKNGEFIGVDFSGKANYTTNSFELALNYYDPNDKYSDFELEVVNAVGTHRTYILEKTTEAQTISGEASSMAVNDYMEYNNPSENFTITLRYSEENISDPYTVSLMTNGVFKDTEGTVVQFRDFTIFEEADFESNTFYVQLDYQDDLNKIDNLNLYIEGNGYAHTFALTKTTAKQGIEASWIDASSSETKTMDLTSGEFAYLFSYTIYGNLAQVNGDISFVDVEGRESVINSVEVLSSADLETQEFSVDVDIINTLNKISYAKLILVDQMMDASRAEFNLDLEKSVQKFNKDSDFIIRSKQFNYVIVYKMVGGAEEETFDRGEITFVDSQGRTSEITAITFSEKADFNSKRFKASLSMSDDFGTISSTADLIFTQENPEQGGPEIVYDAPIAAIASAGEQIIDLSNSEIDVSTQISYQLTYTDSVLGTCYGPSGTVSFDGAETYTYGISSNFSAFEKNGHYYVPLNVLYNDPINLYQSFSLVMAEFQTPEGEDEEQLVITGTIATLETTSVTQWADVTAYFEENYSGDLYLAVDGEPADVIEETITTASEAYIHAAILSSFEIDSSNPTLNIKVFFYDPYYESGATSPTGGPSISNFELVFSDGGQTEYRFDVDVEYDYLNGYYTIDLTNNSDYQEFLSWVNNNENVVVTLSYQDSTQSLADISMYRGTVFTVI